MTDFNKGPAMPGQEPDAPMKMVGKIPPQFFHALQEVREDQKLSDPDLGKNPFADIEACEPPEAKSYAPPPQKQQYTPQKQQNVPQKQTRPQTKARVTGSPQLEELLANLVGQGVPYTEITLPSKGIFYNGEDGPENSILHIRSMTGEEEQILATPRYIKKGTAINMIFQRCVKEKIKADNLLTVDRTYLLIWLRGISYGHEYEVEIKCPECDKKFGHTINLHQLIVNYCPANISPPLEDSLPKCGYNFTWKLPRGKDENLVQDYRERRSKEYGESAVDDSLIYRMALMLDEIEGVKDKTELMLLLKKLPIQDISYLRTLALEPPFGVDTKCPITCMLCYHDFEVELPLEAGFFFPRHKRKKEEISSDSGNT